METEQPPPYGAYAAIMAVFCGGLAGAGVLARALGRVGTWVAAGLGATQIVAPGFGRLLTWTLGAGGLNDFLQAGFAALTNKSNELERRAG